VMNVLARITGWLLAPVMLAWRLSCRVRVHGDPRPELDRRGKTFAYAGLHAHILGALLVNDRPACALIARSSEGELAVPASRARRFTVVRGSGRKGGADMGGSSALVRLKESVRRGVPVVLTVDGPRGPRNTVHPGIAVLAIETDTPVIPCVVIPSRRWIVPRSWDRFQIPKPFCRMDWHFGPAIDPRSYDVPTLQSRVAEAIRELELAHDAREVAARAG
jgi:lysophospholipid acyltransferase (LPLAT)-like uncharacterized protein